MYQAPKVGSVEPLATASLWLVCRLLNGLERGLQVGPGVECDLAIVVERLQVVAEVEEPVTSNWSTGVRSSSSCRSWIFGGAQVDDGCFDLRLVLHAQQLDAVEIDLGQVAGVEAVAADLDDLVVVVQVGFGQIQHGFGLESLHKGGAQVEDHVAFEVLVLGLGDLGAFLGAFQAQFALVIALVQVAEVGLFVGALEGDPRLRCAARSGFRRPIA